MEILSSFYLSMMQVVCMCVRCLYRLNKEASTRLTLRVCASQDRNVLRESEKLLMGSSLIMIFCINFQNYL